MLHSRVIGSTKKFSAILLVLTLTSSSGLSFSIPKVNAKEATNNDLLQFSSQNHILGFQSDGVYVASARHALKTTFLRANNVTPVSDSNADVDASGKVPALGKVTYKNIWNGIDAVYEAEKNSLMKSTYFVDITKKGVTANSIHLRYNRPVKIDANGDLQIAFEDGMITEKAPIAWQETPEGRQPVAVSFKLYRKNVVGFKLGKYLPNYPIVIDPSLTWNTFLGTSSTDRILGIVLDTSGNVYVGGYSSATWGSPVRAYTSGSDGLVAKLDSNGTLLWHTFLGASSSDQILAITLDTSNNIYVSGYSINTWGSPVRAFTSSLDSLVAKLDSNGTLLWHTFLGTTNTDQADAIWVDASGNVYASGYSQATWGSPVRAYSSGLDGYVAKLNNSGTLTWNTFLGGSGTDWTKSISVDTSGNVNIGGYSSATWGSPVIAYSSGEDGFVAKLNSSGTLTWNTFLGGSGTDRIYGITLDTSSNIYVGGYSTATWGSPVGAYTLGQDGFVAKLNSSGTLTWNTFLGGSDTDQILGIAVESSGNVYVGGYSNATWGSPIRAYTSGNDGFAAKLDSSGTLTWNTFFGGSGTDRINGIAADASSNVYVGGYSTVTWGSPVRAYTSGDDGLVTKQSEDSTAPTAAITYSTSDPYTSGNAVTITATFSEAMADSPVPQISISGSQTLATTNMTKVSTTVYTYSLTVGAGNGTATVAMNTGTDAAANVVTSAPTSGSTFTVDNTAPTAAITYSSTDPYASSNAVTITATFSEAMADSPVPQISISGSEILVATNMTKVSTTVYTYAITVGSGNGTATVAMNTGTDASSNVVTSAPTSGSTFTVDNTAPTAAITYSTSDPYASGNAVTITATFSEAMADSPVPQISVSGSQTLAATNMTKVSTTVYTYALTVGSGNGTATVAMSTGTDASSNVVTSAPTSGATFTVTNTVASTETTVTPEAVIHRGGGRGLKSPGRGEDAPMIDFKTMQVISTTDSSPAVTLSSSQQQPSNPTQQSSPAILLLEKKRSELMQSFDKQLEAATSISARKRVEQKQARQLKSIDARIKRLSKRGR